MHIVLKGVFRFCNVFYQEVYRRRIIRIYPNQKPLINSDVRSALSVRTSAFKSGNTDDRKQASYKMPPNDNTKTKLKNNSTPTTQEACGRASTSSQVLKGINKLLWTLPPLYRTSSIFLWSFRGWQHHPHRERSRGCCRRGESTLPFCHGCNPILQMGEHPNSCGSGWYTRPCAQNMRFPTSRGFYRHLQSFPLSVCGSRMLQKIHHCAHTKEK